MSVIGTGTAAAVAQTALQAEQVARRRDRRTTESDADAKRLREMLEAHLRALEEGDEAETPAQLHIDGEMLDHQGPPPQTETPQHTQKDPQADDGVDATEGSADPDDQSDPPLYRHLDVRA